MPSRPRLREPRLAVGTLPIGPSNTITDVPGVRSGHVTVIDEAAGHQTGVTAIVPVPWDRLPAPGAREEAVLNALCAAETIIGRGGRIEHPIDVDPLRALA